MGKNKNDITLDTIVTGVPSDQYLENYDRIFGKKNEKKVIEAEAQLTMILEDDGSLD